MHKYKRVKAPNHPKADMSGSVAEHIVEAEKLLGRPLEPDELVHHTDFQKHNNAPGNFLIMTRLEHQQLPEVQARFLIAMGLYPQFIAYWQVEKEIVKIEHALEKERRKLYELKKKERRRNKNG